MAGSRLELVGTIYSRMNGLLRAKAIKYEDRPIWYDVYRVFPPKYEPRANREPDLARGMTEEVPAILYSEDIDRANQAKLNRAKKLHKSSSSAIDPNSGSGSSTTRRTASNTIITVDTLLSMFQKAKEEDKDKKI